ncbi:putative benzoate 4-monooxygenase cytochrome P450 [Lophiotrema nucula]|uniref:Putative benzoate 4-monooxygenase cytochrome P450 n=1 Tax=Lophiotrema nucula TaxID=690887 RepID=A0A6A5ZVQ5_9PLEO|nr:putative benzoate 4-monooxygenase cytochrome P450 [Lophiotrema nucula]
MRDMIAAQSPIAMSCLETGCSKFGVTPGGGGAAGIIIICSGVGGAGAAVGPAPGRADDAMTYIVYSACVAIYNVTFHPLAKFPGPKIRGAFKFPMLWSLFKGSSVRETKAFHDTYGRVVRIAPDHLSFNTARAFKDIYGTRPGKKQLPKDDECDADHARIRKTISYAFSDTALREQEQLLTAHTTHLVQKLKELIKGVDDGRVNMMDYYNFLTFDVIGDLCLGEPFGAIASGEYHEWIVQIFQGLKFWRILRFGNAYPILGYFFKFVMTVVPSIEEMRDSFFKLPRVKVEKRLATETNRKDFVSYILRYNEDDERGMNREEVVDTASILIVGGSETTATILCGLTYYLLVTPRVMQKLQDEIRSTFSSEADIHLRTLTRLPYLDAVVEEALRMYPPASSIFPRRTPSEGDEIDGYYVPGNTSVGVHQFATYRSEKNFTHPDEFIPERWLKDGPEEYRNDDRAAFQPFHLGPRGCIGKNLAYFEIKSTIARLVWNFEMQLCKESKSWINQNVFLVWEKGPLWVQFRERKI